MTGFGENPDLEKMVKIDVFGPKWAIFDSFCPKMAKMGFFWGKAKITLPYAYYAETLCKKQEKNYERILRSKMYERTHERTDGRTHGRTEANLKVPTASDGRPKIYILGSVTKNSHTSNSTSACRNFGINVRALK